jgi:hypothetical protein
MNNRISYLFGSLLLIVTLGLSESLLAQQAEEYALKASFIERFIQFVEWPDAEPSESFVVGIIGQDPFDGDLDAALDHLRDEGGSVEIKQVAEMSAISSCDLVFISSSEKQGIEEILDITSVRPILTIGDTEGYTKAGVIINFYVDGDRLHFKINIKAVRESGLKLDSFLLDYAEIDDSSEAPDDES